MWTTVFLLALAVNLEPTRVGLVPLLLSRPRPMIQLAAFVAGSVVMTIGFGVLILFVFHRVPFATNPSAGGHAQIVLGSLTLIVSAAMIVRWFLVRDRGTEVTPTVDTTPEVSSTPIEKALRPIQAVLRRGRAPWLAGVVGIGAGLPSPDYLAILIVIGTSRTPPLEQVAALITFIVVGGLVVMAPLVGYALAREKTLALIGQFSAWTRSRSLVEYAGILGLIGVLLIGLGISHL